MTLSDAIDVYATYLNAVPKAREHYEPEELQDFLEDLAKARAEMEIAWLAAHPTKENT